MAQPPDQADRPPGLAPASLAAQLRRRLAVERRDLPILAVAVAAVAMLAVMVATGGPELRNDPRIDSPIAALIDVEELPLRAFRPRKPGEPVRAVVRLPDQPAHLASYFAAMNYHLAQVREGGPEVPRVYLQRLPANLKEFAPVQAKKAVFVRLMLPLVLRANEEVLMQRERLQRVRAEIAGGDLARRDRLWLLALAERYGAAADRAAEVDFDTLLVRVDAVPPALALAQAIQESGWGSSRFARKGNALFGERTWRADAPGLAPKKAKGFKVRAFETLGHSVRAYVFNLNTAAAYAALRRERAAMRARGARIDGYQLAGTLQKYSEEGARYVRKLRGLMSHNGLRAYDAAALRRQAIAQRVIPDAGVSEIEVALAPQAGS